jgi:hypothetical protein
MASCNNDCSCGEGCSRQDDHGGACDCGDHKKNERRKKVTIPREIPNIPREMFKSECGARDVDPVGTLKLMGEEGSAFIVGAPNELTGDRDFDEMLRDCVKTLESKGAEYTIGSKDRLANFKKVAESVDSSMEKVWFTYFYKHYSAVASYIKNGCQVKSNEPIQGRIMDCIVYLLLFHKMTKEIESARESRQALEHGVIR